MSNLIYLAKLYATWVYHCFKYRKQFAMVWDARPWHNDTYYM